MFSPAKTSEEWKEVALERLDNVILSCQRYKHRDRGVAMTEDEDTIVVFTARSPDRIVREGGSQAWILNPAHAKRCRWLVCTQNRNNPDHEFSDATESHGTAFLVGKIAAIERARDGSAGARWMVAISEFARINRPELWDHGRNPVRYASLKHLGIDPSELGFHPVSPNNEVAASAKPRPSASSSRALTIADAKIVLAATFGVRPEAVEITIRG
jgi:hypothetical protein